MGYFEDAEAMQVKVTAKKDSFELWLNNHKRELDIYNVMECNGEWIFYVLWDGLEDTGYSYESLLAEAKKLFPKLTFFVPNPYVWLIKVPNWLNQKKQKTKK